jgi:hypothetical protein
VGSIDSQTVNVTAGNACGVFVLQLITTGANGCTSTCTKTLTIADIQKTSNHRYRNSYKRYFRL